MSLKNSFRIHLQAMLFLWSLSLAACNQAQSAELKTPNSLSKLAVCNSDCFVFNLGDGPNHQVSAHLGKFKNGSEEGSISDEFFAQGKLDGKPAAVAFVVWSTGGTGCWEELALFRLREGKVSCSGIYSLEDRARVNKLTIQNNEVVLDWLKHADADAAPSPSKHEMLHLKSSQFEKCVP